MTAEPVHSKQIFVIGWGKPFASALARLRSLDLMCIGASAAFDHLKAEMRRAENDGLRRAFEQLRGFAACTFAGMASA